ncbi:MAG: hypothetical protein WBA93_11350 [Microcoleaceae cyanobacterium]
MSIFQQWFDEPKDVEVTLSNCNYELNKDSFSSKHKLEFLINVRPNRLIIIL